MKTVFLKWWLFMTIVSLGVGFCYSNNIFNEIYEKDTSYLSNLIYVLFIIGSAWCGMESWKIEKSNKINNNELGWFISELCLTIGMIGTVIGFILMFRGDYLLNIDVNNQQTIMGLIAAVANGMSTALYTTLVGLVCSVLLKIQCFNLENSNNGDV